MVFIRDTELVLRATVELVNTLPESDTSGVDGLVDLAHLEDFTTRHGYTGSRTHDAREVAAVRGIRGRLRDLWTVDRDGAVPLVNGMLADGRALPQLVRHDDMDWHIRVCDADDCDGVYVDFSKNGSKRYCDSGNCGNRMNVNAYRRRRARAGSE